MDLCRVTDSEDYNPKQYSVVPTDLDVAPWGGPIFFQQAPILFPAIPCFLPQMVKAQVGFPTLARAQAFPLGACFQPSGGALQPGTGKG